MKYISLCDGIGAAHVAWRPLGWQCLAVAEIDPYCNAVTGHHFGFPNLGDITNITKQDFLRYGKPDLVIGGTPCQSFSVAGKREGTDSPDGQLIYRFVDIVQSVKPRWILWENVYGVLSADDGAAFASFVHYLAECGYGLAWRVLDARFFGVPQRRRRVFLVGCLGNPACAGKVLFESESLPWDPPPGGSEGQDDSRAAANCLRAQGQLAHRLDVDTVVVDKNTYTLRIKKASNYLLDSDDMTIDKVAYTLRSRNDSGMRVGIDNIIVDTMTRKRAKGSGGPAGNECQNLVAVPIAEVGKRTGRSTRNPSHGIGIGKPGDPMFTLQASARHAVAHGTAPTLMASDGGPNEYTPIVADTLTKSWIRSKGAKAGNSAGVLNPVIDANLDVRRLTPRECERLQGFPDDYTLVPVKTTQKGKVEYMSDTQRYMQLGNSMATPVVQWIGRRLEAVHDVHFSKGGTMPKKTTKKVAKTAILEIPITALDSKKLPGNALIDQWNESYPPGTEVFYFRDKLTEKHFVDGKVDLYLTKPFYTKTTSEAFQESYLGETFGPVLVKLDLSVPGLQEWQTEEDFDLHFFCFPVECFPGHKKYIDDQKCLEVLGMSKKESPKPAAVSPSMKKAVIASSKGSRKPAKKESPEAMKQRQLDEAYSLRNKLQERIGKFADDAVLAKKGIAEAQTERSVIEKLLYDPDDLGFPIGNDVVKKHLIDCLGIAVGVVEGLKGQLTEIAQITAGDRAKLKKVNDRIHRLHTVGPDPQQEFDMEE